MSNLPDLSLGPESFEIPGSIPGEVEQIYQIAKTFQQIATQAGATASQLNGASGDLQWSGNAADQFRSVLGELPGMLNQVSNSYSTASEALSSYALTLSDYRAQFASARSDLANVLEECERMSSQIETAKASGQDTSYPRLSPRATRGRGVRSGAAYTCESLAGRCCCGATNRESPKHQRVAKAI